MKSPSEDESGELSRTSRRAFCTNLMLITGLVAVVPESRR